MSCQQMLACALVITMLYGCSGRVTGEAADTAPSSATAALPTPGAVPGMPGAASGAAQPVERAPSRDVSPRGAAPVAALEVGCTYDGTQVGGAPGTRALLNCPAGCSSHGWVWGTDHYTGDSAVCAAAIHAGVVPAEGGNLELITEEGRQAYRGSRRNGIESVDFGAYPSGFRVQQP